MDNILAYFNGDESAATAWDKKYRLRDRNKVPLEATPDDMHRRLARRFSEADSQYHYQGNIDHSKYAQLSEYGRQREDLTEEHIYLLFKEFRKIVPQGSIMDILGNIYKIGSLSNCFVIGQPFDSYGGIFWKDQELAQLMKRRGGVGIDLSTLRPETVEVSNSAGSSTGAVSFMHRYSNTTNEVAQKGRRGALMITISCKHPDLMQFINVKADLTKVTGANISVKWSNDFMQAVENDDDYFLHFPCDKVLTISQKQKEEAEYNHLYKVSHADGVSYYRKVKAAEVYQAFCEANWNSAEPGSILEDNHINYSPDGVYPQYRGVTTNPCGEIFMGPYDACRLMALNLMSVVVNPYHAMAYIDYDMLYKLAYEQQILADDLVTLEIEHIDAIIAKILADPEPDYIKQVELELWKTVRVVASGGRRTGCGITGMGDMLAALGLPYDSDGAKAIIEAVMKKKMEGELDATIDMAIVRGPFEGWDKNIEYPSPNGMEVNGANKFYNMLLVEFQDQANRMFQYGRRNVSWSTCAPTGTVSQLTQTTGGIEPLFELKPYLRRRKINSSDENVRVDFVDELGVEWQNFPIMHPQIIEWYKVMMGNQFTSIEIRQMLESMDEKALSMILGASPWYGSTANDIDWVKRVEIQSIVQKYTTHSISSTINLPKDVSVDKVKEIYIAAYRHGLKGVTIYRDTCRNGVLIRKEEKEEVKTDKFGYVDAPERPEVLEADYYYVKSKGKDYAVIVGLLNGNPYELFAFEAPTLTEDCKGVVSKIDGEYTFILNEGDYAAQNLELSAEYPDEKVLTRWASQLLRYGANPSVVVKQVEKSDVQITSFTKVIARVLKKYIPDGNASGTCPECKQEALVYQEGCLICKACGNSKC